MLQATYQAWQSTRPAGDKQRESYVQCARKFLDSKRHRKRRIAARSTVGRFTIGLGHIDFQTNQSFAPHAAQSSGRTPRPHRVASMNVLKLIHPSPRQKTAPRLASSVHCIVHTVTLHLCFPLMNKKLQYGKIKRPLNILIKARRCQLARLRCSGHVVRTTTMLPSLRYRTCRSSTVFAATRRWPPCVVEFQVRLRFRCRVLLCHSVHIESSIAEVTPRFAASPASVYAQKCCCFAEK